MFDIVGDGQDRQWWQRFKVAPRAVTAMGLYNAEDAEPLTSWLVKNLDAISDAEPLALAKYILELLSMWTNDPESELKPRLVDLLVDFLQKETALFVDRLLAALRSKSYLPYLTASESSTQSADSNQARQSRSRKRGLEQDEQDRAHERNSRGPPKGPRLDRPARPYHDGHRSRSQNRPDELGDGQQQRRGQRMDHGPPTAPRADLQREKCREYYEFGYCNKGPSCPYSHGDDAMIAGNPPEGMPPFIPPMHPAMAFQMLNGFFPPGWQPGFMGAPLPFDPFQGPMQNAGQSAYGDGIQNLTPHGPQGPRPHGVPNGRYNPPMPMSGSDIPMMDGSSGPSIDEMGNQMNFGPPNMAQPNRGGRGFGRGRGGGGGGRGSRPERAHRSNVVDPTALTLVVEKLPAEKNNIADLSAYFAKFGTVTKVGVDPRGNRALVSFSTHEEAHAAWKSEEAVFGNRFVVMFWHRPAPGGGAAGQRALEASASTLQKMNGAPGAEVEDATMDTSDSSKLPASGSANDGDAVMKDTSTSAKRVEPKTPQEVFEYATRVWMEKMKGVMDVLQSTTSSESEKQEAKTKFKVLKSQKPQPPLTNATIVSVNTNGTGSKEKLDLDLDMLANGENQNLTQEEAQQAFARLQELAAERGIDPDGVEGESGPSSAPPGGWRGGYRGRGWRGGYRGRGRGRGTAIALANASLDNRTRELLLKGHEEAGISDDTALDIVQSFYLPTGQADSVQKAEPSGIAVKFATRTAAELALRSGPPEIEGLGTLSVSWYNHPKQAAAQEAEANAPLSSHIAADVPTATKAAQPPRRNRGDFDEEQEEWNDDDEEGGRRRR